MGLKLLDVSAALNQLAQADPKKTPPGEKQKLAPFFTIMSTCAQVFGLDDMLAFIIAGECMETHRRPGFSAEDSGEILM